MKDVKNGVYKKVNHIISLHWEASEREVLCTIFRVRLAHSA